MKRDPDGPMVEDEEHPSLGALLVRKVSCKSLGALVSLSPIILRAPRFGLLLVRTVSTRQCALPCHEASFFALHGGTSLGLGI